MQAILEIFAQKIISNLMYSAEKGNQNTPAAIEHNRTVN
jgi:hypothetical protein